MRKKMKKALGVILGAIVPVDRAHRKQKRNLQKQRKQKQKKVSRKRKQPELSKCGLC